MTAFTESVVEEAAIAWLQELGYAYLPGPNIAPGEGTRRGRLEAGTAAAQPQPAGSLLHAAGTWQGLRSSGAGRFARHGGARHGENAPVALGLGGKR